MSHKAIGNLLDEVCKAGDATGHVVRAIQKAGADDRCTAEIVVATNSVLAGLVIDEFLRSRSHRGVFGIHRFRMTGSGNPRHEDVRGALVTRAWSVDVNRGTEQALLRDLEYSAALALEREGGYAGVDPRLSVAIARRTIAAHQARRVIPAHARPAIPSAQVELQPLHDTYVNMITRERVVRPRRGVTVAILDSAVNPNHVVQGVRVRPGVLVEGMANRRPLAHGAVTASIIGSLAPTAQIVVYPVFGGDEIPRENDVAFSLRNAVFETKADVIVMCLQLRPHNTESERAFVEMFLTGVGERPVVAVSGNRERPGGSLAAWYPGTHKAVMMVGAVDSFGARAEFSCYDLRGRPRPGLFVVAPGGGGRPRAPREFSVSVSGRGFVGTSVAAAYAAGVVARSLAEADEPPVRAADFYRMLADAAVKLAGWDEVQHGEGLVRELA